MSVGEWSKWIGQWSYDGARWCAYRVKPNAPLRRPLSYAPLTRILVVTGLTSHTGR
jgi:hypothetical protein